jgi:acyl-CoA synthetase (AMP-forming)/AMP-acid ligase II
MGTVNAGASVTGHPDSVGEPRPTVEVEIRGADGGVVAEGVNGDIYLRGPFTFLGYWDDPAATAAALGADGWLRTGDLGRIEHGLLFMSGRRTDLIVRGGENVYPAEIENRLVEHPDVAECTVFGVDHRILGQQVKAVVVRRDGAPALSTARLAAWVGCTLAAFKVPEHFEVRDDPLPRTATGKVMKHVVTGAAESTFVEE